MQTKSKPVKIYRRSALEAINCPKRFYEIYERDDPIKDSSDEALRGQVFHEAARLYILKLADQGLTADAQELQDAVQEAITTHRLPSHLVSEVESLAERWGLTFELDLDGFFLAEETQVLESEGLQWTPDLVYVRGDEIEQIDWKTYWSGITDNQVKSQFQAQAYVWQASLKWPGFSRYRFTFNYPRLGRSSTAVWTKEETEELESVVRSRVYIINSCRESGEWEPIPGSQCLFCRLDCSVKDHKSLDVSRVKTQEQAHKIAGELIVYERAVSVRRDALKSWCQEFGPVPVNGVRWGHAEHESSTFPLGGVMEVLKRHGIDNPELSLSKSALRSYLTTKQHRDTVGKDLQNIADTKKRSVFGSRLDRGDT